MPIAATAWAFADCTQTPFPGKPDPAKLCLKDGFDPASLYELTYIAKDPPVHGIGFAATRDLIAFLRRHDADHPLGATMRYAIAQGTSQSGNYLRSFLHLGFNQDERRRRVFDGMNPNIAARQLAMNIRFAAPSGAAEMFEPGSEGVLWWDDYTDTARGRSRAACWRAAAPATRARRSSRRSGRPSSTRCACHPTWSAPAPTRTSRCPPTSAATTRRALVMAAARAASRTRFPWIRAACSRPIRTRRTTPIAR